MAIDEPASGSGSRGELPPGFRRVAHPREKTYLALVPWRNFRRVVFLILALTAVVALKRSSGGFFDRIFASVAPPAAAPAHQAPETTVHLRPGPPPK